jgi:hypothetical protein
MRGILGGLSVVGLLALAGCGSDNSAAAGKNVSALTRQCSQARDWTDIQLGQGAYKGPAGQVMWDQLGQNSPISVSVGQSHDGTRAGKLTLVFLNGTRQGYLQDTRVFKDKSLCAVGKVTTFDGGPQMVNPQIQVVQPKHH